MRIAVLAPLVSIIAEPQLGGAQALVADLSRGLAERGHDVQVFAASGSRIDGVEVVDTGVDAASLAGTLFRAGGGHSADSTGTAAAASRAAFAHAADLIASSRPDVVHQHAFDGPAVAAAARTGLPTLQVLHLPPTEAVAAAVRAAAGGERPPRVVTVSRAMREAWAGAGVEAEVVRNGVPVREIPWSARPGRGALFAGRLSAEKGALDAIAIAGRAGVALRIVGQPYDPAHAEEVAVRAAAAGVVVDPPVPRRRLWELMAGARAVLCPARWEEPFGLVAAEAQAAGTPVVGYRRGALGEVVDDGRTGALVADGAVDAAAEALADAGRFDGRACREHAERHLGLDAMVEAYERLSVEQVARLGARRSAR
ncbi:MAG: glycosyltransferase [Actinomycetota bacterium]